eukprot:CAMPEP_0172517654 /NCGR_PEP_ID=MMETSP1066-20121228/286846_1 /TAXON_ID=671091 /ORGANISM="Coscinodiscus wailesii, Strain CCMP2513" /LENGTH=44 /DNA_ID= /DNA_START= /DNA_END= /DNA_ORIENTATION=
MTFGNIIHAHLSRVQNACPPNISFEAAIESGDALIPIHVTNQLS